MFSRGLPVSREIFIHKKRRPSEIHVKVRKALHLVQFYVIKLFKMITFKHSLKILVVVGPYIIMWRHFIRQLHYYLKVILKGNYSKYFKILQIPVYVLNIMKCKDEYAKRQPYCRILIFIRRIWAYINGKTNINVLNPKCFNLRQHHLFYWHFIISIW